MCPPQTTAKPQGGPTHLQPDMGSPDTDSPDTDSLAFPRQAQALLPVPTLRCPIHRDRTLRGHISKDLHSQAFLETPWHHL